MPNEAASEDDDSLNLDLLRLHTDYRLLITIFILVAVLQELPHFQPSSLPPTPH